MMNALYIILRESFSVSKKRNLTTTQYSGKVELSEEDQVLLIAKIAETEGCSAEQAVELYKKRREEAFRQRALGPKGVASVYVLLAIFAFALGSWFADEVFHTGTIYFLFYPLGLLLLWLIWRLFTSRSRRMKKAWKAHRAASGNIVEGLEKLAAIDEQPLVKTAGLATLLPMALCVLAIAGMGASLLLPEPLHEQISYHMPANIDDDPGELNIALEMLLALKPEKVEGMLQKAYESHYDPSRITLTYAELANRLADAGAISREKAHEWDIQAATTVDVTYLHADFEAEWLLALLHRLDASDADVLINRFVETGYADVTAQDALGQYCAGRKTVSELLEMNAAIKGENFLTAVLAKADLQQYLTELSDPQQRLELIQYAAIGRTQPNDVLELLRIAGQYGLKPSDCYPDGAKLDWDLSQLDHHSEVTEFGTYSKWLPVVINEKPEPFESKDVPYASRSIKADFESVYPDDYEGNTALGKDAFEVVLDTALDSMPAEYLPETIEELDGLLATSRLYVRQGTLRETKYRGDNETLSNVVKQTDYPCYLAVQMINLYDLQEMKVAYCFCANTVKAPDAPEYVEGFGNKAYYLGTHDEEWLAEQRSSLVEALELWEMNVGFMAELLAEFE